METAKVGDISRRNSCLIKLLTGPILERRKLRLRIRPRNGRLRFQRSQQERGEGLRRQPRLPRHGREGHHCGQEEREIARCPRRRQQG